MLSIDVYFISIFFTVFLSPDSVFSIRDFPADSISLPAIFICESESMNLYNKGGELVIEIENWRRVFYLPQSLSDKSPGNAEFINGHLNIELV